MNQNWDICSTSFLNLTILWYVHRHFCMRGLTVPPSIPCISKSKKFTTYVICRLQTKKVANYQTSDTLQFDLRNLSSNWFCQTLVARPTATQNIYFERQFFKIIGIEVASISKKLLLKQYKFKKLWWRGGEHIKTGSRWTIWIKKSQIILEKSLVARWRTYPNRLSLINMNSKFPGGEVASHY